MFVSVPSGFGGGATSSYRSSSRAGSSAPLVQTFPSHSRGRPRETKAIRGAPTSIPSTFQVWRTAALRKSRSVRCEGSRIR